MLPFLTMEIGIGSRHLTMFLALEEKSHFEQQINLEQLKLHLIWRKKKEEEAQTDSITSCSIEKTGFDLGKLEYYGIYANFETKLCLLTTRLWACIRLGHIAMIVQG